MWVCVGVHVPVCTWMPEEVIIFFGAGFYNDDNNNNNNTNVYAILISYLPIISVHPLLTNLSCSCLFILFCDTPRLFRADYEAMDLDLSSGT